MNRIKKLIAKVILVLLASSAMTLAANAYWFGVPGLFVR
jgi:hypothetical protein